MDFLLKIETGEIEHVADLDGTQKKYCDKNGIHIGAESYRFTYDTYCWLVVAKSVAQWRCMNSCCLDQINRPAGCRHEKSGTEVNLDNMGLLLELLWKMCDISCFVQKVMMDKIQNLWKDWY